MKTARRSIRLSADLEARIDAARGDVSWSRWVERALERALNDGAVVDEPRSVVCLADEPAASARALTSQEARSFNPRPKGR